MTPASPAAPVKNGQYQPRTSTSAKNCVAAVAAMLVERATAGRFRPTHADIRQWVLAHRGGRDRKGTIRGLLLSEAAAAAKALYGVTLTVLTKQNRDQVKNVVGNGRGVGVSIDARVTVNTKRATNDYGADRKKMAGHLVYLHAYQWWPGGMRCECELGATYKHGEFLVEDPGTTYVGYLWWSADLVYRAAEARTGGAGIQLLVSPDTEGVARVCIASTPVWKLPTLAGRKVTSLVPGKARHECGVTQTGGEWSRADGTKANQVIHVKTSKGWGWVPGKSMRLVAA